MSSQRPLALIAAVTIVLGACSRDTAPVVVTTLPTTVEPEVSCEVGGVDGDLYLYGRADYLPPDLLARFEDEYEVEILQDFYASNEELLAKLESGAIYDVVFPSDFMVPTLIEDGYLAVLQNDAVPRLANLKERFSNPHYDPGGTHTVAYLWGTVGLGVNTSASGSLDGAGWGLVFDTGSTGDSAAEIALLDDARHTLGAALKYLGYSINTTDADQLTEASDVVASVARLGASFSADTAAAGRRLLEGGAVVAHGRSDQLAAMLEDHEEYAFLIPADGAVVWVDTVAVTSGAEHRCTAHTFINYLLDEENSGTITNWTRLASANEQADRFIDPDILENPAIYPTEDVEVLLEPVEDLGEFEEEYVQLFAIARS